MAGLVTIAFMAVQFGRLGQGLTADYPLTVRFTNASGLIRDSDVKLAGAKVGHVAESPEPIPGQVDAVTVLLKIRKDIRFPKDSVFSVGSSGLLGDKFVQVAPPKGFDPKKFKAADTSQTIPEGASLEGGEELGINALMEQGKETLDRLPESIDELKSLLEEIHTKILSTENIDNLRASFASIKTTADNFASASKKADDVMDGAKSAVATAKETLTEAKKTMATASDAATDIRAAIVDARGVIKTAQSALGSAQSVLKNAQSGTGAVPMLLGNHEVAENLRALIANIRRHGLLFYRDSSAADGGAPRQPAVASKNKPRL